MAVRKSSKDGGDFSRITGEVTVVWMKVSCGWCMTNDCAGCKTELLWDNKLYMCGCQKCEHEHVPSVDAVDSEPEPEVDLESEEE